MSYDIDDAIRYRTNVVRGLDLIVERVDIARAATLHDYARNLEQIERAVVGTQQEMPCEDGVREFAGGHDNCVDADADWLHDDCVSSDQVLLQTDPDSWQMQNAGVVWAEDVTLMDGDSPYEHGLCEMQEIADMLETLRTETPVAQMWERIGTLAYELMQGYWRP